ncbi:APC family permease [Catellatospora sp. KI3]|uniref:APC family permease n=1 Tax=Catellatospora sp. KI3 TaxID=3041620 RepID=UPI002482AB8C|nr:APC family permease [Catellatospora sp. KI3]MDI1462820.1 APC family permease [Catellatospora sp. KI3]
MSVLTPQAEGSFAATPPGDPELSKFGYTPQLRRSLTFTDLLFYGLIYMVPIAPFAIFGQVFQASGGMVALAYLAGLVVMLFTASSYAQMVKAFPIAGSVYNYAGRGIHPSAGFLAGWAIMLDYFLVPGLLYLVASVTMQGAIPSVSPWVWLVAFVAINAIINYFGIRLTAVAINIMIAGELIVLGIFLVMGITGLASGRGNGDWTSAFFNGDNFSLSLVLGAVSVAALSFLGFDGISMLSEESKGGSRSVGRAMSVVLMLAGLIFIAQTWVASLFTDSKALLETTDAGVIGSAFYDAAAAAADAPWLATLCLAATAIAWGLPDSMVAQTALSRLLFAMARDRQLPKFLAKVSTKHASPVNAVLLTAVVSLAISGTALYALTENEYDSITLLGTMVNFGAMFAWLLLHASVIWHYVVRNGSKNYLLHLVVPIVGIALLVAVLINMKVYTQVWGSIWVLVGLIVLVGLYLVGRRPKLSGLGGSEGDAA